MSEELIRILIVDDQEIVRKGLRALLSAKPGLLVVGEASDGDEAIFQARALSPDVILLDLVMPRRDGISAIPRIKQDNPNARILVLTSYAEDDKISAAIKAGALGYLLKASKPQALLEAITTVHQGKPALQSAIAHKVIRRRDDTREIPAAAKALTPRELTVIRLIAQGLTNHEIADRMRIKERTVTTHVSNILGKLRLANRTQAAIFALRQGLATLD